MIDHKNHYARYCELISLAASCVTSPDAKFAPTVSVSPVFCPSPAGRNCLTVNLQPSAPLTIYSMAAPVPLLPPMISPSAII